MPLICTNSTTVALHIFSISPVVRPDYILHYPDGHDVIVDSKVVLTAADDYFRATDEAAKADICLFCYEAEGTLPIGRQLKAALEGVEGIPSIAIIVGPEGGFSKEEAEKIIDAGIKSVTLGNRILRTETAGFVAASLIQYELGDLGGNY